MRRHHHFRPIFERDDANGRGGGHDGLPDDGCGGCTRKGVDVEKHAGDRVSSTCAEAVSLDDCCDVIEKGVVRRGDEHVGHSGVSVGDWGLGLLRRGGQTQRRRCGSGLGVET